MIKVALDIDDTLCHSCPAFKPAYTHESYKSTGSSIPALDSIIVRCENKYLCEYLKKFISKGESNQ